MIVTPLGPQGFLKIEPKVFRDDRGSFMEAWQLERYKVIGLPETWTQLNVSTSSKGVLRGLHFQWPNPQGKLVWVLEGEVYDVGVDIRQGSPTFGQWAGEILNEQNRTQLYLPPGYAHGFEVLSDTATFVYLCTETYQPENDKSLLWNDPTLGINWHTTSPILSEKDAGAVSLRKLGLKEHPLL